MRETGALQRSRAVADDELRAARAARDGSSEARILIEEGFTRVFTDPTARFRDLAELARGANVVLERAGDAAGLARGNYLLGYLEAATMRYAAALEAIEDALEHARRAGDRQTEGDLLVETGLTTVDGPMPVGEAIRCCEAMMAGAEGHLGVRGAMLMFLASLHARGGAFDRARRLLAECRAVDAEAGRDFRVLASQRQAGEIERLAGDPAAAERELRAGHANLVAIGETAVLSTLAAELADVLYLQGRYDDEVVRLTAESERLAAEDDLLSQMLWRRVRAKVLARRRRPEEAEQLARAAVDLLGTTEYVNVRADALLDLAEVLIVGGRPGEASPYAGEALLLRDAKEDVAGARLARARLALLSAGSGVPGDGLGA